MQTQPGTPPTAGLVAGKYRLIRQIGKGGMGSVWEGQHEKLQSKVAIKFIETEHAVSKEARARFEREALAAATIQSKHAIQIFDHGVTDEGVPYIVMELLVGESLQSRVERTFRLSIGETARIVLQVSRALARAHERGIVHRDLKPDNVFIVRDADDGEELAKVLDFGIAKLQATGGATPGVTSSTKTGAILGTPFYMSPEQARGLRNVDHRTDVWSLGVIAFRCVTGMLPFDGESIGDLLVKICTAPVPMPSQVAQGVPPAFDAWFLRTMEREPERRFGSVLEMANELCHIAGVAGASGAHAPVAAAVGVTGGNAPAYFTPQPGYPAPTGSNTGAPFTREAVVRPPSSLGKTLGLGAAIGLVAIVLGAGAFFLMTNRRGPSATPEHVNATTPGLVASTAPPPSVPDLDPVPTWTSPPGIPGDATPKPAASHHADHAAAGHHTPATPAPPPPHVTVIISPPPVPTPPPNAAPAPKPGAVDPGY